MSKLFLARYSRWIRVLIPSGISLYQIFLKLLAQCSTGTVSAIDNSGDSFPLVTMDSDRTVDRLQGAIRPKFNQLFSDP